MKYNPDIHKRKSQRLKDYDYSMCGYYFVTLCTQNKECFFGDITEEEMKLNEAGFMVQELWKGLPERFAGIKMDVFLIMPNHMHGIIIIFEDICSGECREMVNRGEGRRSGYDNRLKGNQGKHPWGEHIGGLSQK